MQNVVLVCSYYKHVCVDWNIRDRNKERGDFLIRIAFKEELHPNLKSTCFVCYLKIINTFLKNNACILK